MRGLLRPNGPYKQHWVGNTMIPASGREFVVDPDQKQAVIDHAGAPLRLSPAGYEHYKAEFGRGLVCEPVGITSGEQAAQRVAELEKELAAAKDRGEQGAQDLATERARSHQLGVDLAAARMRVSKLEGELAAALAPPKKPPRTPGG